MSHRWRRYASPSDGVTTTPLTAAAAAAAVKKPSSPLVPSSSSVSLLVHDRLSFVDRCARVVETTWRKMSRAIQPLSKLLEIVARLMQQVTTPNSTRLCATHESWIK
ncbi:unnamed protein product [Lampetra planeri]